MAYDLAAEDRHRSEVMREVPGAYRRTFRPVVVRQRHDGWTCEKQAHFIELLGECGCVTEACAAVGMSTASAYRLKARYDAVDFRLAWDAALTMAVGRVEDGVLGRAINGVPVPHYYQGEQVGEHRRYDERLALFILRYRKPFYYGKFRDGQAFTGDPEADAERFAVGIDRVFHDDSRTQIEEEAAEAAAAHATRDAARAARAIAAAAAAADKAAAAAARAAATGEATDAKIARETADWAATLDREADAAAARASDAKDRAAEAAARAAFGKTNHAGGDVAQPSQTSAPGDEPERFKSGGPGGRSARQRRAERRRRQRRGGQA